MWNMSAAVGAEVVWLSRAKGEGQQQRKIRGQECLLHTGTGYWYSFVLFVGDLTHVR